MSNQTNDSKLKSWVPVAADSDFPIQNLPFGVFRRSSEAARVGVAIGEHVLDLSALHAFGGFAGTSLWREDVFAKDCLNDFLKKGRKTWGEVRERVGMLLAADNPKLRDDQNIRRKAMFLQKDV